MNDALRRAGVSPLEYVEMETSRGMVSDLLYITRNVPSLTDLNALVCGAIEFGLRLGLRHPAEGRLLLEAGEKFANSAAHNKGEVQKANAEVENHLTRVLEAIRNAAQMEAEDAPHA